MFDRGVVAGVDHLALGSGRGCGSNVLDVSTATDQGDNLAPLSRSREPSEFMMAHGTSRGPREEQMRSVMPAKKIGLSHCPLVRRGIEEFARSFLAMALTEWLTASCETKVRPDRMAATALMFGGGAETWH